MGLDKIIVIERENELGGILQQCIHNGFGLHKFKEELTGPEYAQIYIYKLTELGIEYKVNSTVVNMVYDDVSKIKTLYVSSMDGFLKYETKCVILAMGCFERTRGAISIPGDRPAGIFTAGQAQKFVNMNGYMVGKEVVILGSGDIGLIMARRMTLEGANVKAVVEISPFSNGLNRNIVQCLDDYNIPLYLSHTITDVKGTGRLESVTVSKVDENKHPIKGTEFEIKCDTLLLSVGLIPDNNLSKQINIAIDTRTRGPIVNEGMETNIEGVFACGNVLHVHDLVDYVSDEAEKTAQSVVEYLSKSSDKDETIIDINTGNGIVYSVPQNYNINSQKDLNVYFRVNNIYTNHNLIIESDGVVIKKVKKRFLQPSEMEKIKINSDIIKSNIHIYLSKD